jgi:glycosyltransferase involved in cell wall biosynthesis
MELEENMVQEDGTYYRFTFISSCPVAWGGSEELWFGAAKSLLSRGHALNVLKTKVDYDLPQIRQLKSMGCMVHDLLRVRMRVLKRVFNFIAPERFQLDRKKQSLIYAALHLKSYRPDLVIISQGDNFEGLIFTRLCRRLKIPYVLISQKVTEFDWPDDEFRPLMHAAFKKAVKCFFVSRHNQRLTEAQINDVITNAEVVWNPFMVPDEGPLPWPSAEDDRFNLACVARLFLRDKGQDILLHVLAMDKWKSRNLHVTFLGEGHNKESLMWMAKSNGVENVSFPGHTSDVQSVWRTHHGLVMPSRSEGLPLSLVEAMMCGRPAIVTNAGGNAEVVEESSTGFIGATSIPDFDAALERAWQRRYEWQKMGELAAKRIRDLVPPDPSKVFADELLRIVRSA